MTKQKRFTVDERIEYYEKMLLRAHQGLARLYTEKFNKNLRAHVRETRELEYDEHWARGKDDKLTR